MPCTHSTPFLDSIRHMTQTQRRLDKNKQTKAKNAKKRK